MLKRLRFHAERARTSLFFVPVVFVVVAVAAAGAMLRLDVSLAETDVRLPAVLQTTTESARSLLSTIASATITVAGVVFAITLVSIQLASSQFSPRVIPGFLRDSRQQRVMGLAVGTFAYSLVVLRAVRGPDEVGPGFIPHLSSVLSLVLAIVTIVALIAFLDRSASTMQVGNIVHRLTLETIGRIRELYPNRANEAPAPERSAFERPAGAGHVVRATTSGWVCHIDVDTLRRSIPEAGTMRLDVRNGSFVAEGQSVGEVWPPPDAPEMFDRSVSAAMVLGESRIMLQDVSFGVRQLVDIGLRALSPGTNDPTTAYDVIVHLGLVVRELLWRDLSPDVHRGDDRELVTAADLSHSDYVNRAFDQIRLAGAEQSAIAATLLQTLGALAADLNRDGLSDRTTAVRRQAALVLATYEASDPLQDDLARVFMLAERHGFRQGGAAGEPDTRG
jgi:uncharacterized membrane protein